jgi:CBS domain-containing protein
MNTATLRSPIQNLNPSQPVCVKQKMLVNDVVRIMQEHSIGCVCVVDDQNTLVGIFTERDVLTKVLGEELDINKVLVEEVMTPNPEYLYYDDEIVFALNRMHVGGFRHVPLIDVKGRPMGVISVKDIVAHLIKNLEKKD